jgi:hypothetical protein
MLKWMLLVSGVIVLIAGIAIIIGQSREKAKIQRLLGRFKQRKPQPVTGTVRFDSLEGLPGPVKNYFRHVLVDGQPLIQSAGMRQSGKLRTGITTGKWLPFTASQYINPAGREFLWDAKVELPLAMHIRVLDGYQSGIGSGQVSFLSAFTIFSDSRRPELNSGALHRFLAEAVWYPTALLPQSGVDWQPISDHSALATITDNTITVSLEFRFNEHDEVTGIYSPGRYRRFDDGYKQVPWEGHFRNYIEDQTGIRVPAYGEVGWCVDGEWQAVWKGNLIELHYDLAGKKD